MAGSARLQTVGEMRYALDFAGEGAALWRHSPAGGWEELARDALQLGQVSATMARLRKAARVADGQQIPVEVWLPEPQMIIKPINTGGVPPVPAMIEHAFASATPDGLAGVVLDQNPQASGPMHIYAGVAQTVIDETIAFLEPYRFQVTAFTRPEAPAGLDHVPVVLPKTATARRAAGVWPLGAVAAAAAIALLAGGAWLGGLIPGDPAGQASGTQGIAAVTEVRQVTVAPDLSPSLSHALTGDAAPAVPRQPQMPQQAARAADPVFAPPLRPGPPAPAQSEIIDGLVALALGEGPTVSQPSDGPVSRLRQDLDRTAAASVSDGPAGPIQTASPAAASTPAFWGAAAPEVATLSSPARPSGPDAPTHSGGAPALPDLTAVRDLAAAVVPVVGDASPLPPASRATTTPAVPAIIAGLTAAAYAQELSAPAATLPLPSIAPTATPRPAAPAVTDVATQPQTPPPDESAPLKPGAEGSALVAEVDDATPTAATDPGTPEEAEVAALPEPPPSDETQLPVAQSDGTTRAADTASTAPVAAPDTDDAGEAEIASRAEALPPDSTATPDVATTEPVSDTAEVAVSPDEGVPASNVVVIAALPDVIPARRPAPDPVAEAATAEPGVESEPAIPGEAETDPAVAADDPPTEVRIVSSRPDILPPRRPGAAAAAAAAATADTPATGSEATEESADIIAALIANAGELDLSPSDRALTSSVAPRKRPAGLVAPTVASAPRTAPGAGTSLARAPDPAPSTRRAPPLPTTASVARAATIENALPLRQMALIGVYGRKGRRHALIRMANGRYVKVEPGDTLSGFEVSAISPDAVRLRKRGRDTLLVIPE